MTVDSQVLNVDRDHMSGVEKGLKVIECFDEQHSKLTIADVSRMSELSRAAARRCLLTLANLGFAEYDGKFFRLTPRILRLGYSYLSSAGLPRIIQPTLERVGEDLHEACSAAVLDGYDTVYIARYGIKRMISSGLHVGACLPAFCTSMGRVLLAGLPPDDARQLLEKAPRPQFTDRTVTDVDQIMRLLENVRRDGYSLVDQELELGLIAIAVPVRNSSGVTAASLNIGVQSQRMNPADLIEKCLERLRQAERSISLLIE